MSDSMRKNKIRFKKGCLSITSLFSKRIPPLIALLGTPHSVNVEQKSLRASC